MEMKGSAPPGNYIDLLLDAVCVVDAEGHFVYVSAAFERIFGYRPEEIIGTQMIDLVAPEDRARTLETAGKIMSGIPAFHFENRYVRKDGQIVHIMWSARWSESDRLRIAVARDITARNKAESMQAVVYAISEAAHAAEDIPALFHLIHQIIGELLPVTSFSVAMYEKENDHLTFPYHADKHHEIEVLRAPATEAFCSEILRTGHPLLLTPDSPTALSESVCAVDGCKALCWLGVPLNSHKGTIGTLILKSYPGDVCYTAKDVELMQFLSTQVVTAIDRKQFHARLQYMAQYDRLTGLPNRALLYDRLKLMLARTRRQQGRMAVLFLDLNNFKGVNDSLGHAAGDLLLQNVATRLKQCLRDSDTVARMGGDEFVVLLEDIKLAEYAEIVAEKIRRTVMEPVVLDHHSVSIEPSIGMAFYPEHGEDAESLLKHADAAMYHAKKDSGRGL